MKKANLSYILVAVFFSIAYLGFTFSVTESLIPVWLAFLGVGVLAFILRIFAGHD